MLKSSLKYTFVHIVVAYFVSILQMYSQVIDTSIQTISLGEDSIQIITYKNGIPKFVMVHVHENEEASLAAGKQILAQTNCKLVTIKHTFTSNLTRRNISFKEGKINYTFDPNRIFTDDPNRLRNNIVSSSKNTFVSKKVVAMVKKLSSIIWDEVDDYPLIVALHNNRNEPTQTEPVWFFIHKCQEESYNVTSYVKKSDQPNDSNDSCEEIYINPRFNNSEFLIVTEKKDFLRAFQKRLSVVLQNELPIDDGSMSVYSKLKNKRYINSEAKHGRDHIQYEMLQSILSD